MCALALVCVRAGRLAQCLHDGGGDAVVVLVC